MVKNIRIEPVRKFAQYIIYTGFVSNIPYPASGIIIAPPERAKSTEIAKFECLGVMQVDKATALGFAEIIQGMNKKELEAYHHFIIVDLEQYASYSREVKEQFLSFVRGTAAEGVKRYRTKNINLNLDERKQFGFLMCTTPDDLGDKRSVFRSLSFLDRLLPFTYNYSEPLRMRILEFVAEEEHNAKESYVIKREKKEDVKCPKQYSDKITPYAVMMAKRIENVASHHKTVYGDRYKNDDQLFGVRSKENLISFLKAIALYDGRNTVIRKDFDEFVNLYRFMNFKFKNIDEEDGGD